MHRAPSSYRLSCLNIVHEQNVPSDFRYLEANRHYIATSKTLSGDLGNSISRFNPVESFMGDMSGSMRIAKNTKNTTPHAHLFSQDDIMVTSASRGKRGGVIGVFGVFLKREREEEKKTELLPILLL